MTNPTMNDTVLSERGFFFVLRCSVIAEVTNRRSHRDKESTQEVESVFIIVLFVTQLMITNVIIVITKVTLDELLNSTSAMIIQ